MDQVNHPPHYNAGNGIECLDAIEASMSPIEFRGYLKGNVEKYLWRYTYKGHPFNRFGKSRVLFSSADRSGTRRGQQTE